MPCPTGSFKIISRGKGQSCMASCAYYSGEKKYSEYECCWKYPHSSSSRVKWVEVMLPPNNTGGVCRFADALERGGRSGNKRQRADGALDALCFAARTD